MEASEMCLQLLEEGCSKEEYTAAVQTLLKICRNIQQNLQEEKYRKVKKENKTFNERVWRHEGAQQFLMGIGFVEVDESIMLLDTDQLNGAVNLLEQQLRNNSSSATPAAGSSQTTGALVQNELSEKDKVIAEERRKVMEKVKRDKEEKRRISEQIKADRRETSTREVKESHGRKLPFGANFHKFENKEDNA